MIVVPDLFGAYQKGREAAVEANWNDLKNYENIEAMRTRNDRDALQLLADQADYNINRSMMRDNGDVSALNTALAKERFYSDVYNARTNAMLGQAQYGTTMAAAADGSLRRLTDDQYRTTTNNVGTNLANSGVNFIDANARWQGLSNNLKAYYDLVNNTVGYNIDAENQTIETNKAILPYTHTTTVNNAVTTANDSSRALAYSVGRSRDLPAITQTGANTTESDLNGSRITNVNNQQALEQARNQPHEERKAKLAQLLNQRTLVLQNIQLAVQAGDRATADSWASQYGNIDAEIVRLGGKSQLHLVLEAAGGAPGVPPSTATTQVPTTPTTQPPPTKVPQQLLAQPQPTTANLFNNQRGGAGGFTNTDWARIVANDGVGSTGGYW